MGFRFRLASFIVATLIGVQALTAVLVYEVTRHELIGEGQRQLAGAAGAFARQLDDISERVASSVQVLSLDYALRAAIAQRDEATLLSALHNHGRRVGATQMPNSADRSSARCSTIIVSAPRGRCRPCCSQVPTGMMSRGSARIAAPTSSGRISLIRRGVLVGAGV